MSAITSLCITRRISQRIIITVPGLADPIVLEVADVKSGPQVRLRFEASREVSINREGVLPVEHRPARRLIPE